MIECLIRVATQTSRGFSNDLAFSFDLVKNTQPSNLTNKSCVQYLRAHAASDYS